MANSTILDRQGYTAYLLPQTKAIIDKKFTDPIIFQFLPNVTGDTKTANYQSVGEIIGRSEQFQLYKSSNNRQFSIEAVFAATGHKDKLATYNSVYVQRMVARIRALTEPIYNRASIEDVQKIFYGPPRVLFTLGNRFVNIPIVITSVKAEELENSGVIDYEYGVTSSPEQINGRRIAQLHFPTAMKVTIDCKTNYPYGYVPGYLNTANLFPNEFTIQSTEADGVAKGATENTAFRTDAGGGTPIGDTLVATGYNYRTDEGALKVR